jgi:hypothetical protein
MAAAAEVEVRRDVNDRAAPLVFGRTLNSVLIFAI